MYSLQGCDSLLLLPFSFNMAIYYGHNTNAPEACEGNPGVANVMWNASSRFFWMSSTIR